MATERQRQVLDVILRAARRGMNLSVRDIADKVGLKSPATVYGHLKALVREGLIEPTGRSRRYRVTRPPGVPIVGRIQAGAPIESDAGPLGELAIDPSAFTASGDVVALKVAGSSMQGAGIFDGDYVVIRRQPRVENGEIAAVLVNGGGTLKRVSIGKGRVVLKPENARFEPIAIDRADDVQIFGRLVAVLRGGIRVF